MTALYSPWNQSELPLAHDAWTLTSVEPSEGADDAPVMSTTALFVGTPVGARLSVNEGVHTPGPVARTRIVSTR